MLFSHSMKREEERGVTDTWPIEILTRGKYKALIP